MSYRAREPQLSGWFYVYSLSAALWAWPAQSHCRRTAVTEAQRSSHLADVSLSACCISSSVLIALRETNPNFDIADRPKGYGVTMELQAKVGWPIRGIVDQFKSVFMNISEVRHRLQWITGGLPHCALCACIILAIYGNRMDSTHEQNVIRQNWLAESVLQYPLLSVVPWRLPPRLHSMWTKERTE